jgi:multisubunit Na+/H+ antiporter MnhE subunit
MVFGFALALIALYFGDQALEVTRLPFSTLAFRDLLNALLMAMMCVIFAWWAVITIIARRKHPANKKGGTP